MSGLRLIILLVAIWLALVLAIRMLLVPALRRGPGRDPVNGLMWWAVRLYGRLLHRVRLSGQERLRDRVDPGPLVVVSNHTGSVDPFLIQAGCRFEIRWLMASDQMAPGLDWMWKRQRVIPVARDGSDSGPARVAIRHVKAGGVVGIFPEGRIVTPPRRVWPFLGGVGLIVARTRAPVLLVWVSGTPETNSVTGSLLTPSQAEVRFVDLIRFEKGVHAATVAETLRKRLHEASGWPLEDHPPAPTRVESLEVG